MGGVGETVRAMELQVALFCATVTSLYSGSTCSSAWAGFSECVHTVLGMARI